MRRLLLLALVMVVLAPGTWVRTTPVANNDARQILAVGRLQVAPVRVGQTELAGAWQLTSPNKHFGGFSAMMPLGDGTMLILNDQGGSMRLRPPRDGAPVTFWFEDFIKRWGGERRYIDIEAVVRDPLTGTLWIACEALNQIELFDPDFRPTGIEQPLAMRFWPSSLGPESLVRLSDGRFIVLAEGSRRWFANEYPALLFEGDPLAGAEPT